MAKEERGKQGEVDRAMEVAVVVLIVKERQVVARGKSEEEEERESEGVVKVERLEKVATAIVASCCSDRKCESGLHALRASAVVSRLVSD